MLLTSPLTSALSARCAQQRRSNITHVAHVPSVRAAWAGRRATSSARTLRGRPQLAPPCASPTSSTPTAELRAELNALEAERDTAIKTGESCAMTATKLAEMAALLEKVALEKVRGGDAEGARLALKEKASALEVLEKNSSKADANYRLAAVLTTKIASKQAELLSAVRSGSGVGVAPSPMDARPSSPSPSSDEPKWKWQQSLEEARARLAAQEEEARREGRWARLSAEQSIAEAKARISSQVISSVAEAQQRLRAKDAESQGTLEAARARLRARDAEVMGYVRRVMARYRRGEYVSDEELEFAFQQLEKRFVA